MTEIPDDKTQTSLQIGGMTCANCDIAVERALKRVPGVRSAVANYAQGRALVHHDGPLDMEAVRTALHDDGYALDQDRLCVPRPRYAAIGAALIVVLALILAGRHFDVWRGVSVTENMTLGFVFVIGLLASVSSCMAVTGGLLVALAAKYNEATPGLTPMQRLVPHLFFNAGRVLSYMVFGALIGSIGSALTLSPAIGGMLTITVSVLMIAVGLQMLGLFPRLLPQLPKRMLHRVHDLSGETSQAAAFALGAATFFLPCGFTIALQLYVLAKADPSLGALTMLVFSLGTLPALLGLSLVSSFASGRMQMRFLTLAGVFILVLGAMNIQFGLVQMQAGSPAKMQSASDPSGQAAALQAPQMTPWRQVVEMKVDGFAYHPNRFTVKAGVPVEWRVDGRAAEACGRVLISRSLGLQQFLSGTDVTVITFTPKAPGEYAFNCSMGMMTPNSGFTVVN